MARESDISSSRGNGALYFIVGALVAVVGVLAYFLFGGDAPRDGDSDVDINVTAPAPGPAPGPAPAPAPESGSGTTQ